MKKTIIRKVWKAWANYERRRWEVLENCEGKPDHLKHDKLCGADKACNDALVEWYTLNELCEELKIDWLSMAQTDAETAEAANEHSLYADLIWEHTTH